MSPPPVLRECSYCGLGVMVAGRGKNSPRYCSPVCRTQAYYLRNPTMRRRPKNRKELTPT